MAYKFQFGGQGCSKVRPAVNPPHGLVLKGLLVDNNKPLENSKWTDDVSELQLGVRLQMGPISRRSNEPYAPLNRSSETLLLFGGHDVWLMSPFQDRVVHCGENQGLSRNGADEKILSFFFLSLSVLSLNYLWILFY